MRFTDRVAIVTGGSSGIGLETSRRLAREGARVVVADLSPRDGLEAMLTSDGAPGVWCPPCDVSDDAAVARVADGTMERYGRLDVVVNNAGLMLFRPLVELTADDWLRILRVDLLGAFFFTRQAFLKMKPGGTVVNVSSIHAVETEPLVAPYAAAKAALLSLTRSYALEGRPLGLRVNAILPGAVDTPMLWDNPNVRSGVEHVDRADVGSPEDVAAAILYLASDDARFVQGAALRVDGGRLGRL